MMVRAVSNCWRVASSKAEAIPPFSASPASKKPTSCSRDRVLPPMPCFEWYRSTMRTTMASSMPSTPASSALPICFCDSSGLANRVSMPSRARVASSRYPANAGCAATSFARNCAKAGRVAPSGS